MGICVGYIGVIDSVWQPDASPDLSRTTTISRKPKRYCRPPASHAVLLHPSEPDNKVLKLN